MQLGISMGASTSLPWHCLALYQIHINPPPLGSATHRPTAPWPRPLCALRFSVVPIFSSAFWKAGKAVWGILGQGAEKNCRKLNSIRFFHSLSVSLSLAHLSPFLLDLSQWICIVEWSRRNLGDWLVTFVTCEKGKIDLIKCCRATSVFYFPTSPERGVK